MNMKAARPLALTAATAILAVELIPPEHHKQQHIESIQVASPGAMVSNAANVALSTPIMVSNVDVTGGLVLPESGRYLIVVG
jgi:hypothetical protein